jgi:hypothetical protein
MKTWQFFAVIAAIAVTAGVTYGFATGSIQNFLKGAPAAGGFVYTPPGATVTPTITTPTIPVGGCPAVAAGFLTTGVLQLSACVDKPKSTAACFGSTVNYVGAAGNSIYPSGTLTGNAGTGAQTSLTVGIGTVGRAVIMPSAATSQLGANGPDTGWVGGEANFDLCAKQTDSKTVLTPNATVPYIWVMDYINNSNLTLVTPGNLGGAAPGGTPSQGYRNATMQYRVLGQTSIEGYLLLGTNSTPATCYGAIVRPDGTPGRTILAMRYPLATSAFEPNTAMQLWAEGTGVTLTEMTAAAGGPGCQSLGLSAAYNGQCWVMTQFCPYNGVSAAKIHWKLTALNADPGTTDSPSMTIADEDYYTEGGKTLFGAYNSAGDDKGQLNSNVVYWIG